MKETFTFTVAALAAIALPAMAHEPPSVSVDVTDLDLTRSADQEKLERRIDHAVSRVCRLGGFDAETRRAERECRLATIENADKQVDLAIAKARTEQLATIDIDVQG